MIDLITVFFLIILIFSIVIHEFAHGSVAYSLGDSTAKDAGRLTINPIKHIDPVGSLLVPFFLLIINSPFLFGWAKPVPINPYNFKNFKSDNLKVSLAGPLANISIALFLGLIIRFFSLPLPMEHLLSVIIWLNLLLGVFNLIPIPPLDGSHILFSILPANLRKIEVFLRQYGMFVFIFFIFFGLNFIFFITSLIFYLIVGHPFFGMAF